MARSEVVLCAPVRTAIGTYGPPLKGMPRATMERAGVKGPDIDTVVLGQVVLATRLLHSMRRDDIRRGMVTLCIGGGQGIALALVRL